MVTKLFQGRQKPVLEYSKTGFGVDETVLGYLKTGFGAGSSKSDLRVIHQKLNQRLVLRLENPVFETRELGQRVAKNRFWGRKTTFQSRLKPAVGSKTRFRVGKTCSSAVKNQNLVKIKTVQGSEKSDFCFIKKNWFWDRKNLSIYLLCKFIFRINLKSG